MDIINDNRQKSDYYEAMVDRAHQGISTIRVLMVKLKMMKQVNQ